MVTSCSALGCTNRFGKPKGVTFHRFPLDKTRRRLWAAACGRHTWATESQTCYLCSEHFEQKYFDTTGQTVRLRENTIPTIFPTLSSRLLKKMRKRSRSGHKNTVKVTVNENDGAKLVNGQQAVEEDAPSTHTGADDGGSSGRTASVLEKNCTTEASARSVQNCDASPNMGSQKTGESTASLQRCQQEILLLRQTLHNYKQRAWYMDIVLSSLRKENELLRGALQELSPGQLNHLLDLHGS